MDKNKICEVTHYCLWSWWLYKLLLQDKVEEESGTSSSSSSSTPVSPGTQLVRKLVSVLESSEKLPLYVYDIPGAGSGLQVLSRRLRFRLERAPGESSLIDRNGRTLKVLESFNHAVSLGSIHSMGFCWYANYLLLCNDPALCLELSIS